MGHVPPYCEQTINLRNIAVAGHVFNGAGAIPQNRTQRSIFLVPLYHTSRLNLALCLNGSCADKLTCPVRSKHQILRYI